MGRERQTKFIDRGAESASCEGQRYGPVYVFLFLLSEFNLANNICIVIHESLMVLDQTGTIIIE